MFCRQNNIDLVVVSRSVKSLKTLRIYSIDHSILRIVPKPRDTCFPSPIQSGSNTLISNIPSKAIILLLLNMVCFSFILALAFSRVSTNRSISFRKERQLPMSILSRSFSRSSWLASPYRHGYPGSTPSRAFRNDTCAELPKNCHRTPFIRGSIPVCMGPP